MSKQDIVIGNRVDDGTGDYLRRGGAKINNNFQELYSELGDGTIPHPAGAWKRYNQPGTTLTPKFGDAYTIDTTAGQITVNLPQGSSSDYGKVIRLRDVNGTWGRTPVKLVPSGSDTIKGDTGAARLGRAFLDAELVYCAPGKWEYAENKLVTGITNTDHSTVMRRELIASAGQTDFTNIFDTSYNPDAIEIYRRGNLLYHGDKIDDNSDYGSMLSKNPTPATVTITSATSGDQVGYDAGVFGSISSSANKVEGVVITKVIGYQSSGTVTVRFSNGAKPLGGSVLYFTVSGTNYYLHYDDSIQAYTNTGLSAVVTAIQAGGLTIGMYRLNVLDGKTIRLADPCEEGDPITFVSYVEGIASYRTSYTIASLRLYDETAMPPDAVTIPGQIWVGDLSTKSYFTLDEFDFLERETFNPNAFEVLVNGVQLTKAGTAGLPAWGCVGASAENEYECQVAGGVWVPTGGDYSVVQDANGRWRVFSIDRELEHDDILTIRWFNNDLGTVIEWDGDNGVKERCDARYLNIDEPITRTNRIQYKDTTAPKNANVIRADDELGINISTLKMLFDSIYPVGTIYKNAHNPANPADYMGMGKWVRYSEGRVIAGWNASNPNDANFGLNNNDLDVNGNPRFSAGGTSGGVSTVLTANNLPPVNTVDKMLIVDAGGDVLVGGCQFDPDEQGPGFTKYREDVARIRPGESANPFNVIQPTITAYVWLRVE